MGTKKAATLPQTSSIIKATPPDPPENPSGSVAFNPHDDSEPIIVFFDNPEDSDYVYDEADRDEEDVHRSMQVIKQMKALNLKWKKVVKKRFRGRGRKLFEDKHPRTKQRDFKGLKDRIARGCIVPEPLSPSDIIVIDSDEDGMHEEGAALLAEDGTTPEVVGVSPLESAVIMTWVQSQEGNDAAGGGEELALDLQMDELADGNPDEQEEVEVEVEEDRERSFQVG
ncbi:hypothetical protein QFC21_006794 [Naganishia friedmannii]|uniref:Uncharacterized protein n=1 Tax=Naganishia friedmannii TaxID=89922 RepID=A0ACC2V0F7_9TREE|nr:hypothetical protein QFC21_006794 [Naganishia friedmannii]